MSSRRKASTPCMIRPEQTMTDLSTDTEPGVELDLTGKASDPPTAPDKPANEPPDPPKPQRRQQGGYECKYCPFSTQNLNTFKEHVDANHPNVILNPLYLCAVCNFNTKKFDTLTEHNERCHPGESNFKFKRIKLNNQTILEQTIEGCSNNAAIYNTSTVSRGDELGSLPLNKPTTVKIGKPKIMSSDNKRTESQLGKLTPDLCKTPITAVNVNGTVIIPETTLLKADGLSHIMPSLQRPLNYTQVPKIAVPLNTTKYNPSLDDNLTLISSFNKFPYPTQAELSWLTAASKHPEEQIKVWFTTQRLKQGISWSPEEVEEARKKMFNGTISSVPQTFAVVAPQLNSQSSSSAASKHMQQAASLLQSLPCQLLGQTSLVLTPVANGSTVTCAPLAFTVSSQVVQSLKRPLASPVITTESKRPSIIQTISAPMAASKLCHFFKGQNVASCTLQFFCSKHSTAVADKHPPCCFISWSGEIKKWFSEQRLLNLKGSVIPIQKLKDNPVKKAVPSHFPLLERVKGKSSEQLKALEESFQRSSSPTDLAQETRLSKTEVECWFSERRALRDNMEQALLTMTSKTPRGQSGAAGRRLPSSLHPPPLLLILPILSASTSPAPISGRSLSLLREVRMFCRAQWPSPEEYSQLEVQTSLGRTDIVRWFKDHRSALKNGETLDWLESFQNQNVAEQQRTGQEQNGESSDKKQSVSLEVKDAQSEFEVVLFFSFYLYHHRVFSRLSVFVLNTCVCLSGRWVKVTVAVGKQSEDGEERQKLATDTDVLTLEQPGRVTG
uniref:Zinc fingers and homeoboxes 2a n=1 Tax=Labrus bergylta TaxID=56723 RepID=A0A3Q3EMW1_9LABR